MSHRLAHVSLYALTALPLVLGGCAYEAGAPDLGTDQAALAKDGVLDPGLDPILDPDPPPPEDLAVSTTEVGDGWKRIKVTGTTKDIETGAPVTFDRELVVIENDAAITKAPVAAIAKEDLLGDAKLRIADGTTNGEVMIVDPQKADEAEAASKSGVLYFSCSSYDKTLEKSLSTTKTFSYHKSTEPGSFSGAVDFTATLVANAKGKAVVRVKKKYCVPYGVSFKYAQFTGKADVTANAKVDGAFEKTWHFAKKLAEPSLGSVSFSIAFIPVVIRFSAPIDVGLDASAKATLKFDGKAYAKGTFDVTCTSGGCSGSKSATYGFVNGTPPTMSAEAKVDVTPWVQGALRASVYDSSIGYGQVGVKAKLDTELWAYAGNACGDADGDGTNEFVTAAALDARVGVDVTAKAAFFGHDIGSWAWPVVDKHVGFWKLGSAQSALSPILSLRTPVADGTTVDAKGRMRPCWPWNDEMKYRITWNDGTIDEVWEKPSSLFTKSHSYASYGRKMVSLVPLVDAQGRTPGVGTTDEISLGRVIFEPVLVKSMAIAP